MKQEGQWKSSCLVQDAATIASAIGACVTYLLVLRVRLQVARRYRDSMQVAVPPLTVARGVHNFAVRVLRDRP